MLGFFLLGLLSHAVSANPIASNNTYEYIVVGSGPGGGPLAVNLARAGHSVLLLEAGDDQGDNTNVSVAANFIAADNDPKTRWDFFVKHSDDPARENKYLWMTYRNANGSLYAGTSPASDAKQLGIYYPRAATLGGCAMHNAAIAMNPNDLDWDDIANLTKDDSWAAHNMRKYLVKLEHANYNGTGEHGHSGWLQTTLQNPGMTGSSDGVSIMRVAASKINTTIDGMANMATRDMNGDYANRDQMIGFVGGVSHVDLQGKRSSPGYYVKDTVREGEYPLTLQLQSLVTKILFSKNATTPTAIGVEFLKGPSLYSADPRYDPKKNGTLGQAFVTKEVIIAGGVFNTPQILKLSGIGPADELKKFDIPVVVDSPGVGMNMGDNYEGGLMSLANRPLQGNGGSFTIFHRTSAAKIRDIYMWCGSFSFEGFWPGFPKNYGPSQYECAMVHMNPRSQAGTVTLRSADPRDTPEINQNFFLHDGDADLTAMLEAAKWTRNVLAASPADLHPWTEQHPCPAAKGNCTDQEQKDYLKEQAYSHHATSSARIGADGDHMAVLDSRFRVRGVKALRVVDGSAFPKVPGAFPVLPTMMLSEKATEVILEDNK